jgi:superfamily II RNA helicase
MTYIMAEHPYTFPLDDFQTRAINAIAREENVLVTAKTGSGKTLVGEYQIWHSLKKGKRVFYTTPIKSLTNQKFHDLKQLYPSVGIMTGDIKFAPQSDIVVLTTEILRNLLYKKGSSTESLGITASLSLDDVDAIVFDEVHYINDPSRGKVWEECFILLPPSIRLVLLSATIDTPEPFSKWLAELKGVPMNLISTSHRVVPLYHKVGEDLVMGPDNTFNRRVYESYLRGIQTQRNQLRKQREAVRAREDGQPAVPKDQRSHSFVFQLNEHIQKLEDTQLLPALFFVFSRKNCVQYASKVTASLVDSSDSAAIKHILNFHLHRYPDLKTLPQYYELEGLLLKGIAYHHSGLLPILKEIVEILFGRGLVRVLFATETFAVGINMPTKTVVFTSYRKYDDLSNGLRMLRTDEYIQMAGRAGRRGKDTQGIVYYLPDHEAEEAFSVEQMMTGKQSTIVSQMDFGVDFILKSLQSGSLQWKDILSSSYYYQQTRVLLNSLQRERASLVESMPESHKDCELRWNLEQMFKVTVNAARKDVQRNLEAWKNRHMGPTWDRLWKDHQSRVQIQSKLDTLDAQIEHVSNVARPVELRLASLEDGGYIHEGQLTVLGKMAAEINEGDPLVMSRLFMEKTLHSCSPNELIAKLAQFLEPEPLFYWSDFMFEWMNEGDLGELCQRYEIDAGTAVRAILKLANIAEEWTILATMCADLPMLETMKGVKEVLVRGIVVPDSLYLRL